MDMVSTDEEKEKAKAKAKAKAKKRSTKGADEHHGKARGDKCDEDVAESETDGEEEDVDEETGEEVKENVREVEPAAAKQPSRTYARRHPPRGRQTHRVGVARTKGPLPLPVMDIIEWTPVPVDDDDYQYSSDCPSVEV